MCHFDFREKRCRGGKGSSSTFQKGVNHPYKEGGTGLVATSCCKINKPRGQAGSYLFLLSYRRYWVVRGCSAIATFEDVSGEEADCKRQSGLQSHYSFEPVRRSNLV